MTRGTGSESHPDKNTQEPEVDLGECLGLPRGEAEPAQVGTPLSGHAERWGAAGTFGYVDNLFITRYNCTKLRFECFPRDCGWIM